MSKIAKVEAPSVAEIVAELEGKASESFRKIDVKQKAGDKILGIKMGDLRVVAKRLKNEITGVSRRRPRGACR